MYKVVNGSYSYLGGLQALKKKGVEFCIKQLNLGVEHFARITAGDYSKIQECFKIDGFLWSLTESDSDEFGMDTNHIGNDGDDEDDKYGDEYQDEIDL